MPDQQPPNSQDSKTSALQSRIRHAYRWSIVGSSARYAASFVVSLVLARLLKPEDYGLLGMISVFTELLGSIFDWSLAPAIVHFGGKDTDDQVATYFSASLALGAVFTTVLFACAPLISHFYREPRLVLLLRVMSLVLIIVSVRTVSGSILLRDLRFRILSIIDVGASLAAGFVAVILAFFGFGVWSLVVNLFVLFLGQALAYSWYVRPRFSMTIDKEVARRLWRFGAPLTGSSLAVKAYENADYLVVGRILGAGPLGSYSLAFRLAMLINERISSVINRAAFPTFAKLKDEPKKFIDHWYSATKRVTLLTFPLLVGLAFNAHDFITVVLGQRWIAAVVPLQFLCIMTAVKILTNIVYQLLQATGHPSLSVRYDLATAIVLPCGFYFGAKWAGLLGVGLAWCTIFPFMRFLFLLSAKRVLPFSFAGYMRNIAAPLWLTAVCAVAMVPALMFMRPGLVRLISMSAIWLVSFLTFVSLNTEMRSLIVDTMAGFRRQKAV